MIQVVIGIVFVLLLFSLLATTIMELVAGFLSLRGKQLHEALLGMIGDKTGDFISHPFFQQLTERKGGKKLSLPSYINSGSFSAILFDVLEFDSIEDAHARVGEVSNPRLRKVLQFLLRESGGDLVAFRKKTEEWFNEVMDRASGWYKRKMQYWLFFVGLGIALVFNADTVTVYHNLSVNAQLRDFVAGEAKTFVATHDAPQGFTGTLGQDAAKQQMNSLLNENIAAIRSPLGLGWDSIDWSKSGDPRWWIFKVIGWLVTAMAVSLGAPFWFDLLKKIVNVRSSGPAVSTSAAAPVMPTVVVQGQVSAPLSTSGGGFLTKPGGEMPLENYRKPAAPPSAGGGGRRRSGNRGGGKPPQTPPKPE